ncbi:MAG TPA: response regulator [Thermodesulfobacteriota bacterium]|nr:response regulator [Deltaproteobacteria bacterium]HQT98512.1 response regulator [Thermodesulfobacteriota bacterium]
MPKKLLLAEDSLTIRRVFELALSCSDIAITAVDNGEDAVRLAGEISPDLVVADLTLPGKNGFAVAAELRAMEKTEKIPVLILSGTLVPLDEARLKASGARGVLFKPFESRELLDNIERLLREGTAVPESGKPQEAPAVDERWDFSDVLDEVEAETGPGKSAAPAPPARDGLLPGAILPGGARTHTAFNEFDVSIDEIEGGAPKVEHIESDLPVDSPSPVTDLSPALDEVEEIEEIEHLEDVEVPLPPTDAVSSETPSSIRIFSAGTLQPVAVEPVPAPPAAAEPVVVESATADPAAPEPPAAEPSVAEHAVEESPAPPPASFSAPFDAGSRPGEAELREFFAGRAAEIFRTVASEAVEKVMWEMTDRLAAEFSAKLRESVEAVAWEVIPSTAEALIREEIARIRSLAGKPSP